MTKKKKGLYRCVYCGRHADTRDHIPSKCLLSIPYPNNLLTVPACKICNNSYSKDEEYLLNILAMIGTSKMLLDMQESGSSFERAINRNSSLYDRIIDSLSVADDNRVYLTPEHIRVERISLKIACGLYYKKYKQIRPINDFVHLGTYPFNIHDSRPPLLLTLTHTERFIPKKWTIIQKDAFSYIVVRNWQNNKLLMILNFHDTLWSCIEMKFPVKSRHRRATVHSNQTSLFGDILN